MFHSATVYMAGERGVANPYVIETRGLGKEFQGFRAVSGLNLKVRRHQIHALIGPNGAGKSTVFNLLTKFLAPSEGAIFYKGKDITGKSAAQVARMGMVRSFQISAIFPGLSVLQNVRIALQRPQGTSFHFWRAGSSLSHLDQRAHQLLEDVNLASYASEPAAALPYGRRRALEFATTLALDPELLLLDEPLAGMGNEDIERTAQLIRRVAASRTVLMVEHNLSVVEDLSDTITVLRYGEILAEGTYAQVSNNPDVIEAYIGSRPEDATQ